MGMLQGDTRQTRKARQITSVPSPIAQVYVLSGYLSSVGIPDVVSPSGVTQIPFGISFESIAPSANGWLLSEGVTLVNNLNFNRAGMPVYFNALGGLTLNYTGSVQIGETLSPTGPSGSTGGSGYVYINLAGSVSPSSPTGGVFSGETTISIGSLINSATSKTTPVDPDQLGLMDSENSNILKKLSWANIKATLKAYFDTIYATTTASIQNGLNDLTSTLQSTSTPPTISSGNVEVNGTLVKKTSSTNIALSSVLGNSKQVFNNNCWAVVGSDSSGNLKWFLAGGTVAQASQSVTLSTGTTTKTLTVAAVPGSGTEKYIAYVTAGSGSYSGVFEATRASATTFTIVLPSDPGNTTTGMTVTLRFKSGTATQATDANYNWYTPSMVLNPTLNGFYLDTDGQNTSSATTYRVITEFCTDGSAAILYMYSYGSGSKQNNNYFHVYTSSARGSGNTGVRRWTTIYKLHGVFSSGFAQSSTDGDSWTAPKNIRVNVNALGHLNDGGVSTYAITKNSTTASALGAYDPVTQLTLMAGNNTGNAQGGAYGERVLISGDVIRFNSTASDAGISAGTFGWVMGGENA